MRYLVGAPALLVGVDELLILRGLVTRKYGAEVKWPAAASPPIAAISFSEVVRLAIGIFAGSRPAARYCRCSATTESPTTVEKITFGCADGTC